jgi:hypothetical protein
MSCRKLLLALGDQLDRRSAVLDEASPEHDPVLMIEARSESRRIQSHKARSAMFFAAMRHCAGWLRNQGFGEPGPARRIRLAGHPRTGARCARRLRRPPARAFRTLPGCDVGR